MVKAHNDNLPKSNDKLVKKEMNKNLELMRQEKDKRQKESNKDIVKGVEGMIDEKKESDFKSILHQTMYEFEND